jgi:hypothetical protein
LIGYFNSLLRNLEWSSESRCELTSNLEMAQTPHRCHLEIYKISNFKAQLPSSALIAQLASSLSPYELVSQLLAKYRARKPSVLPSHSKTARCGTYGHVATQTASSLNSLDNYCYRRTWHTTNSYPNFFRTAEHKLSAYPPKSD